MEILAKRNKAKDDSKKNLKIPILGISDNIIFSKKEVWAYYKITTVPFDFLSGGAKAAMAERTITALASLCQSEGKKVDGHILVTSVPLDILSWANQVDDVYYTNNGKFDPPYEKLMNSQIDTLIEGNYQRPVVYFGVKLFNRGSFDIDSINVFEFGFKDAAEVFKKAVSNMFQVPNEDITTFEEQKAKNKEKEIFTSLEVGDLRGVRVSSEELLLTLKRQFYPSMPTPYLEVDHDNRIGLNDIAIETGGVIENQYRALKFNQEIEGEIYEGYRATLSFARFPQDMRMPGPMPPFLYMPAQDGYPYTMSARFTMIPHSDIKKDLNKKKLEATDEIENLSESGQSANASITGTVRDIAVLEDTLEQSKLPWLSGSYRVTIEAPDMDSMRTKIAELKQSYSDVDTTLVWTTGDQLDLFIEEMPGSNIMMNSFNQRTNLAMLGISGFNIGGYAGDPVKQQLVTSNRSKRQ